MKSVEVKKWVSKWGIEISLVVLLYALVATAGSLMPNFLKVKSQLLLSRHVWEMGILALGMTLIVISGGIDLSVGSTMALAAVGFGIVFGATGLIWLSALTAILIGLSCGALNGWLIARFKVHPLIITLATFALYRGVAEGVSQGESYSRFGDGFSALGRGMWLGVPLAGYLFVGLAIGI